MSNQPKAAEQQPRLSDNDHGEISVTLHGREIRGWSYENEAERRMKMLAAREYVEGWCDGRDSSLPALRKIVDEWDRCNREELQLDEGVEQAIEAGRSLLNNLPRNHEEADMTFMQKWREIPAQLATILKEIRLMRTSTQHLTEAIGVLTTAVQNGNAQIKTELETLLQSHNDDDDAAVEASVAKIKELAGSIDSAVSAAQAAVANTPADKGGAAGSAPQPQG